MDPVRAAIAAAATAYTANLALGLSVATGRIDTSGFRWVHHGIYIVASGLTVSALTLGAAHRRASVVVLAPALVPLFLLQRHGAHPVRRHGWEAVSAAPFYIGALALRRR